MRYKREKHYPPPYPDIRTVQSAAHGLAYDAGDVPRRHEHFFFEIYLGMERPKGVISQKNWDRIFGYTRQAKRNLVGLMKTWPRRRIPRPRRVRPCQVRGWTWTRRPLANRQPPPRRRRFIPPCVVDAATSPPRAGPIPPFPWEGRPCRREPGRAAVTQAG